MLTVEEVFYSKNCFKIKVETEGHYIIGNKIYPLSNGSYVIHAEYSTVRELKNGDIVAPLKPAEEIYQPEIEDKKIPKKKKSFKKSKKQID